MVTVLLFVYLRYQSEKCNECKEMFAGLGEFLKHIADVHGFEYETVDQEFQSENDYKVRSQ
jgi:hypothetical protein